VLSRIPTKVKVGMYVVNPFGQTGSENFIKHKTKVTSIRGSIITLSLSLSVEIPKGAEVCFIPSDNTVAPWELSIEKGAGRSNFSAVKSSIDWKGAVSGLENVSKKVKSSHSTVVITVEDLTSPDNGHRGVLPGQKVTGTGVKGVYGDHTFVKSVDGGSGGDQITLSDAVTLSVGTVLYFSSGDGSGGVDAGSVGSNIKMLHMQGHLATATNAVLQGYVSLGCIKKDHSIKIYFDDIFNRL
jgi:hypothetical protein